MEMSSSLALQSPDCAPPVGKGESDTWLPGGHFSPLSPLFRHPTQAPVFVSLEDGFLRKKLSECSDGRAGGHFTRGWGPVPARKEGPRKEACHRDQIWCAWVSNRLRFLITVSSFLEKVWETCFPGSK